MHRHAAARAELLASIERDGEQMHVLCNLANATTCVGLQEEGVALARRAIALAPDATLPRRTLCNTLPYRDGVTGAELLAALRDCSDRLPRDPPPAFTNAPHPERPLVIGLLSGSLRTHPVGWLTVAGFETLDPAAFSIICLAQNGGQDWIARRFRSLAREWHDVDTLSDPALAEKARALGIDILYRPWRLRRCRAHDRLRLPDGARADQMGRHTKSQLRSAGDGLVPHRSLGNATRVGAVLFGTAAASA